MDLMRTGNEMTPAYQSNQIENTDFAEYGAALGE
jgi:hypothetical protein